ncbi:TPA: hypothetical protein DEO28_03850 [Candidatus Dependentiae bacterium]|nr:MAG: hypothetical protein UR14_C0006G0008 [candidate division TM6 bacterium GW2011_GWE2_31_21]KKP53569.1 MAG: hypothetical protein UR43_C0004G0110 [candidate division TM6 bacterium GW2011_GWF2_33_332]HBS48190.1 hypothetical protein [Candidatus Dependentiae bacterium]HBZ73616.1 hypothetical protein [Candidatus Dependentiae bacterium]
MKNFKIVLTSFLSILTCLLLSSCYKYPKPPAMIEKEKEVDREKRKLDFLVENTNTSTLFITCFYYAKPSTNLRWEWRKTQVLEVGPNKTTSIKIGFIPSKEDYDDIYGYLGIFDTKTKAEDAIFELTADENKADLDRLSRLKGEKVVLYTIKYGLETLNTYRFDPLQQGQIPELDFYLTNKTGANLYINLFAYEQEEGQPMWEFDRNGPIFAKNGETIFVDVDTIKNSYSRQNVRGYLAAFEENEKTIAENSSYELLKPENKINLGYLSELNSGTVILTAKKYGILTSEKDSRYPAIEFTVKNK